jgi:hypothetical protein
MDPIAVLRAYDEQVRRHRSDGAARIERTEHVVRSVSSGWRGVLWCGLDSATADAAIAAEIERFAAVGGDWEWKWYSHDRPADLPDRLLAAGFTREDDEALLFAELAQLPQTPTSPHGVELRPVRDEADVAGMVAVQDQAFGGDSSEMGAELLSAIRRGDASCGVVAWAGSEPIGAGRLELNPGTEFASLWGGATVPAWRRRGVFHATVAHRAAIAAAAGYRYLHLDASPDSRPIMLALGFTQVGITAPFRRRQPAIPGAGA